MREVTPAQLRRRTLALLLLLTAWKFAVGQDTPQDAAEGGTPGAAAAGEVPAQPPAAEQGPQQLPAPEQPALLTLQLALEVVAEAEDASGGSFVAQLPGSQTCWVQSGAIFYGADLELSLADLADRKQPLDCCLACWETPGCGAWTYNASNSNCYLKHPSGWQQLPGQPNMTSGVITALTARGYTPPSKAPLAPLAGVEARATWLPPPAGYQEGQCAMLPNSVLLGERFAVSTELTAGFCCRICASEPRCSAFVHCGQPGGCDTGYGELAPQQCDLLSLNVSFDGSFPLEFSARGTARVAGTPHSFTLPFTSGFPLPKLQCQPGVPCEHIGQPGETLQNVSQQYSLDLDVTTLLNWQLPDPNNVTAGQAIKLPCCAAGPAAEDSLGGSRSTALKKEATRYESSGPLQKGPPGAHQPPPNGSVQGSCMVLPNSWANGTTFQDLYNTTAEACCEACGNNPQCTVWVFCGEPNGCNDGFGAIAPAHVCDLKTQLVSAYNLTADALAFKRRGYVEVSGYPPGYTVPYTSGYVLRSEPPCHPNLPCEHVAKPGEFMWNISQQYGVDLDTVVLLNWKILDPNYISPDQVIKLPCCAATRVGWGEPAGDHGNGSVAGIAAGCAAAGAAVTLLAGFVWWRRHRRRRARKEDSAPFKQTVDAVTNELDTAWRHDQPFATTLGADRALTSSSLAAWSSGSVPELPFASATFSTTDFEVETDPSTGKPVMLGSGHFGQVYRGQCGKEPAAIKIIKVPEGEMDRQHLLREVAILKSCRSQYLVWFLGALMGEHEVVIVTELLPGGTLFRALKAGKVTWYRRGLNIAIDVARGLDYLHRRNIIHLDLKSPNVLLTMHGRAKVADVGLARLVPSTQSCLVSNADLGTFAWAAPEQLLGQRCSYKADIYAYGVLLWEICTGLTPVRGHLRDVRVPEECPQAVAELIAVCMSTQPEQRPTAEQIIDTLAPMGAPLVPARAQPAKPTASVEEGRQASRGSSAGTPGWPSTPSVVDRAPEGVQQPAATELAPPFPTPTSDPTVAGSAQGGPPPLPAAQALPPIPDSPTMLPSPFS